MEKYIDILMSLELFSEISEKDLSSMMNCLKWHIRSYKKGAYVYRQGDRVVQLGILVQGQLQIRREDYWGNSSLLNVVQPGEMFGESYITPGSGAILNDVFAGEDSSVLFLDAEKLLGTCPNACKFHSAVIKKLLCVLADKNRKLVQKLGHMSQRSTRKKLVSYLSEQAAANGSPTFCIPFNRQQLADFLAVDRSAMSNELCKMRDEGMIKFNRNNFTLIQ